MAIITETDDSVFADPAAQSITLIDSFEGTLTAADDGDRVALTEMTNGLTYTVTVSGLGESDRYAFSVTDLGGSSFTMFYEGGVDASSVPGLVSWFEGVAGSGELRFTFVAPSAGPFELGLSRVGSVDGDVSYEMVYHHGAVDQVSEGNDSIMGDATNESWTLLEGNDLINTFGGDDTVNGGLGDDTIRGGDRHDVLNGDDGNDSLLGGNGTDTLDGGDGNDVLGGGRGADVLNGGIGRDHLSGGKHNDYLDGGNGDDRLYGGDDNDTLLGGNGDDRLFGGSGEDTLNGGIGNDTLDGGFGSTVYVFEANSGQDVIKQFLDGFDRIDVGGLGIMNMSGMTISQSGSNVLIDFDGTNTVLVQNATAANFTEIDFIFDTLATTGTSGNDVMNGSALGDFLDALQGDDLMYGNGGDDILVGNDGRDTIVGGAGNDTLDGGFDNDTLNGGNGNDLLLGLSGNDNLKGAGDNDTLAGETGKDTLDGGTGDDVLAGGTGNDILTGGDGADIFVFQDVMGDDFITDFENGVDLMNMAELVTAGRITGFGDLTITQVGGNTMINVYGTSDITLIATTATDIDASDFIFV